MLYEFCVGSSRRLLRKTPLIAAITVSPRGLMILNLPMRRFLLARIPD